MHILFISENSYQKNVARKIKTWINIIIVLTEGTNVCKSHFPKLSVFKHTSIS